MDSARTSSAESPCISERQREGAFSKSWREHFHCLDFSALAIPFIANEWTRRGGGGVRPAPPPPELYLEPIFHRTAGRHTAIRRGTNPTV